MTIIDFNMINDKIDLNMINYKQLKPTYSNSFNKKQCGTSRYFRESYLAEYMCRKCLRNRNPFVTILKDTNLYFLICLNL